jgi:hypothetical protein
MREFGIAFIPELSLLERIAGDIKIDGVPEGRPLFFLALGPGGLVTAPQLRLRRPSCISLISEVLRLRQGCLCGDW